MFPALGLAVGHIGTLCLWNYTQSTWRFHILEWIPSFASNRRPAEQQLTTSCGHMRWRHCTRHRTYPTRWWTNLSLYQKRRCHTGSKVFPHICYPNIMSSWRFEYRFCIGPQDFQNGAIIYHRMSYSQWNYNHFLSTVYNTAYAFTAQTWCLQRFQEIWIGLDLLGKAGSTAIR